MMEFMKKVMFTSMGLAAMTRDKVEELAKEFANQAHLSNEKGKEFVDELVARSEKARKELESNVQRMVNDRLRQANIATHEDVAQLNARLEQLEKLLAEKLK